MEGCLWKSILGLLLLPSLAFADKPNAEWLSTTRALSMGNVGIASADDPATAAFYNPATLAKTKRTIFEFFNPQVEFGTNVFAVSADTTKLGNHVNLKKLTPYLQGKPNKASYLGASIFPNLNAQNFNFGILLSAKGQSYVDGAGNLNYKSRYLLIPSMGLSIGLLGGRFKLGASVRAIQITENDERTTNFTDVGYMNNPNEGFGVGVDVGSTFSLPWTWLPTFGFVARNLGDTTFSGSAPVSIGQGTIRRKGKVKMTYDGGFSVTPKTGRQSAFTFAADYRDIMDVYGVNIKRRINLGMEFSVSKMIFMRLGFGRGYWTAGIGVSTRQGSLDIGTYGEELHEKNFRVNEDRRISIRYGSKF
ncbi:MAG: hypothetical protein M9962_01325 [Oligoflexia bacterium]|nr:hypothetical protein [Oligoflexia bacterium]